MTSLYQVRLYFIISLSPVSYSNQKCHSPSSPLILFLSSFLFVNTHKPSHPRIFFFFLLLLALISFSYFLAFLIPNFFFFFFLLFISHPKLKIHFSVGLWVEIGGFMCCLWWHWVCGLRLVWLWVVYGGILLGGCWFLLR